MHIRNPKVTNELKVEERRGHSNEIQLIAHEQVQDTNSEHFRKGQTSQHSHD